MASCRRARVVSPNYHNFLKKYINVQSIHLPNRFAGAVMLSFNSTIETYNAPADVPL
jgi:hypothetical protein